MTYAAGFILFVVATWALVKLLEGRPETDKERAERQADNPNLDPKLRARFAVRAGRGLPPVG